MTQTNSRRRQAPSASDTQTKAAGRAAREIDTLVIGGGQAGLAGHLEVEDGIMLGAKCGVPDSLRASDSRVWSGIPVMPHPTWLRMSALMPKLPELFRRVKRIEESINPKGEK